MINALGALAVAVRMMKTHVNQQHVQKQIDLPVLVCSIGSTYTNIIKKRIVQISSIVKIVRRPIVIGVDIRPNALKLHLQVIGLVMGLVDKRMLQRMMNVGRDLWINVLVISW